jgi:beta-galactosidase
MNKQFYFTIIFFIISAYCSVAYSQTSNDHIFPAAPAAKPYIDFDSKGFLINGKRTFIVSAGIEYARVPHQLWYDRLLRIKRAGFNCVEIYTFWNFHEPEDNKFDFTGDHDLGLFLATVKKLGMYAIVRVGPYYCAEWDLGGYPLWLKFKKGVRVREDNRPFENYVDRFFDKLLPIVFQSQINKGGPVIMVQLENEHIQAWGTVMPNGYFKHLQSKALSLGLQVPYFFSGLHHSSDPAGNDKLDDPTRPNPWFSTEFWSVWYSQYGPKPKDAGVYDRRTWKIIAHGGNGYNYYMAHGGSNFAYTNNDEDAASYDYGAAIGQAGDLRPIYYTFKRAAWFARSFQEILENSTDATNRYSNIIHDTSVRATARTSAAGDIIFLDNQSHQQVNTRFAESGIPVTLEPGEIYPVVHNFKISPEVTLDWAYTRVFAIVKQHHTTTIITDCRNGEALSLHFIASAGMELRALSPEIKIAGGKIDLDTVLPESDKPLEYAFTAGVETVRVLAMNRQQTDKTWIADAGGENYIVSGTDYAGKLSANKGMMEIETEMPLLTDDNSDVWLYNDKNAVLLKKGSVAKLQQSSKLTLNKWQQKSAFAPSMRNFNSSQWVHSKNPLQMGVDGNGAPDAWYRTTVRVSASGKYTIQVKGGGRGQAFIDGEHVATWKLDDGELPINLKKGKHTLAIFAAHDGRDKLAGYMGPIADVDNKGIYGPALIKRGGPFISRLDNWYFAKASAKEDVKKGPPAFDTTLYKKYTIGNDAFNQKEGFGWFETTIDKLPAGTTKITLLFRSVDENATVFINGRQIYHHDGWNDPFQVTVSDAEMLKKPVRLTIFVENYSNEGGIDQPVKINTIGNAGSITNWDMKGGPGNWQGTQNWQPVPDHNNPGPCYYRTGFTIHFTKGATFIWRVEPKNMGYGSVWVNGHNLGRYPEKIDAPGLYIPECWLKEGANELVIYDEDGRKPYDAAIIAESAASRTVTNLTTTIH